MAVPKKKASRARTRRRYHVNSVFKLPELYRDRESGALVRRHYVNEATGVYRGHLVVAQESDASKKQAAKQQ